MVPDQELLSRYCKDRDEAAFAELVRRHLPVVYSAAVRQLPGAPHLAEDAAQMAFVLLARKASSIAPNVIVAGWLHRSTRFAVKQILRAERRRVAREQASFVMNEISRETEATSAQVDPLLDEALDSLNTPDRDVLVLRYFEHKSFAEISSIKGLSEDAARKRINRAVDKLRRFFSRRGIATTASLLNVSLAASTMAAPPAGLGAVITKAACGAAAIAPIPFWINQTVNLMKAKTVAGCAIAAVAVTSLFLQHRQVERLKTELQSLRHANQAPSATEPDSGTTSASDSDTNQANPVRTPNQTPLANSAPIQTRSEPEPPPRASLGLKQSDQFVPSEEWQNRGASDAPEAFETFLWAGTHNDVDRATSLIHFESLAKDLAAENQPAMTNAALGAIASLTNLASVRILLAKDVISSDDPDLKRKEVTFQSKTRDGQTHLTTFQFSLRNGEWGPVMKVTENNKAGWAGYVEHFR
jgi:RNA polymerase sigma factor (sigma-70 family)